MAQQNGNSYSIITNETKIKGEVFSKNDIRFDGEIEGEITCGEKILFGPKCLINGDIECKKADISGEINGSVSASEIIRLRKNSKLTGPITAKTLIIEEGAIFNGTCSMAKETDKIKKQYQNNTKND